MAIPSESVILFTVASTIFSIVGPKILGNATTEIFNGILNKLSGGTGIDFGKIATILLSLLVLYLISALFNYIESISMTDVSNKFAKKLRNDISLKINKLPLKFFDKNIEALAKFLSIKIVISIFL